MQVRNRGTIGGSLAEADPSGDWATVLMTLKTEVRCQASKGDRAGAARDFIKDAYTTALEHDELVSEVIGQTSSRAAAGLTWRSSVRPRSIQLRAQPYNSRSKATACKDAAIALGCVGLTAVRAKDAEDALRGTVNR